MSRGRSPALLAGDVSRLLREALAHVHGAVVVVTVTAPGEVAVCPCCGVSALERLVGAPTISEWNRTFGRRWRRLSGRIRSDLWRQGLRTPRVVAWVGQRQGRGADHLHLIFLARTADERARVAAWVARYRELHVGYGLGFVDDPFRPRGPKGRTMLFERAQVAGAYLGKYLAGGQLEAFLGAEDRSLRGWWVSPVLMGYSGWSLARCRWVRQAWALRTGAWSRRTWYGATYFPSWWLDDAHRAWVLAVTGWDGSLGECAGGSLA